MSKKRKELSPLAKDRIAYDRLTSHYGLTKTEIAAMIKISKQAVSKWETVPVKYVTLLSQQTGIAKALLRPSDFG